MEICLTEKKPRGRPTIEKNLPDDWTFKTSPKVLDYQHDYYQKNKHLRQVKVRCSCGVFVQRVSMKVHIKTKRHREGIDFIDSLTNTPSHQEK